MDHRRRDDGWLSRPEVAARLWESSRLLEHARGSVRLQTHVSRLRAFKNRWVDHPLTQLERARRAFAVGAVDVVYLGDSSALTWSFDDAHRLMIPDLLTDQIAGTGVTIAGPGYRAAVWAEAVRLLSTLEQRPRAVVMNLNVRTTTASHVTEHPQFNYRRSLRAMRRINALDRPVRSIGRGGTRDDEGVRAAYLSLPVNTRWGGVMTMGEFRDHLVGTGPPPWSRGVERARFNYFHGEVVPDEHHGFADLTQLGVELRRYGVPVITWWSSPPLQRGEQHFPGEFEEKIRSHYERMKAALRRGAPELDDMVEIDLTDDDYEDSRNAYEHYRAAGRAKIAAHLTARVMAL